MDITEKFPKGRGIAPGFIVMKARNKPMIADMANPITQFAEVTLDCLYENIAFLAFATFTKKPPLEQWMKLGLSGREKIRELWQPQKVRQECVGVDYNKQAEAGHLVAISHLMTVKNNVLVSAQLVWYGFPLINKFYVGFKPGMRERAEALLLAGLKFV